MTKTHIPFTALDEREDEKTSVDDSSCISSPAEPHQFLHYYISHHQPRRSTKLLLSFQQSACSSPMLTSKGYAKFDNETHAGLTHKNILCVFKTPPSTVASFNATDSLPNRQQHTMKPALDDMLCRRRKLQMKRYGGREVWR